MAILLGGNMFASTDLASEGDILFHAKFPIDLRVAIVWNCNSISARKRILGGPSSPT
ncbi:hypothetical protein BDR03DRAFT_544644 [Suillus americanus]|nr:hypothetical protein BDR03DRAFT_544644 [Suillus americanus]